jgi:hypothetical protein
MLGLLKGRGAGRDGSIPIERIGDRIVHAIRIDRAHDLVRLLVDVLTPYNGAYRHVPFLWCWKLKPLSIFRNR